MTPETEYGEAEVAHELVAATIICAVGVMRAVELDDQKSFATAEVRKIWPNRKLAGEFEAA